MGSEMLVQRRRMKVVELVNTTAPETQLHRPAPEFQEQAEGDTVEMVAEVLAVEVRWEFPLMGRMLGWLDATEEVAVRYPLQLQLRHSKVHIAPFLSYLHAALTEIGNITDQGIISTAIANAAALSTAPQKGQENVSLLEQQSKKSTPTNTQFTFTCESDSSKGMAWQQNHFSTPPQRSGNHNVANSAHGLRFATQGTQTSPNMAGQTGQQGQNGAQATGGQQNPPGKKPPRRPGNLYALSARQRRLQQEYSNLHHPPNLDEIWICEFCEYESIFGHPPEALIRQYEIKDRKERRRLAEKRRLLEKAKLKGRKGKKATKNAAKAAQAAAAAAQQPPHQPKYDPQAADQGGMLNHGTQSEEYLEDEYDDEPIPMPAPPPQTPLKQPSMSQQMKSAYQARQVAANGIGKQRGGGVTGREP